MTERMPTGFANYNGDQTHLAGREEPMGPNYMGVGFSLMAPEATS